MSQDTTTVTLMARRAAERLKPAVVVTPTMAFGISEHWMDHKGTLTVTPQVFCRIWSTRFATACGVMAFAISCW